MAKLLGTNVGTIQQDLSILLKDESIEVNKEVIFSNPKYGVPFLTNYTLLSTKKQKTFFKKCKFWKRSKTAETQRTVNVCRPAVGQRPTGDRQLAD